MTSELSKRCITGTAIGLGLWYIFFYLPPFIFSLLLCTLLMVILITEMPRLYNYKKPFYWFATLAYPIAPFFLLIALNQHYQSQKFVLIIFAISFANDIGAYFVGKFFGKHKLCTWLSPKKTIEGFIGGWVAVFALITIFYKAPILHAFIISFICALVATTGDLFESWLKRRAHVKDSGNLLPGHGGLLDRFDSILAITVLIFFYRVYIRV